MKTVLVVDDMRIIRDPIAETLRAAGYHAVCAADGREAIVQLKKEKPRLMLLDISMPVMDGLSVLEVMRADPSMKQTHVILLTAEADKDCVIRAARLGVRDYILKTQFSLPDLLARVKKHLPLDDLAPKPVAPAKPATPEKKAEAPAPAAASKPVASPPLAAAPPGSPVIPVEEPIPVLLSRGISLQRAEKALSAKTMSGVVAQIISTASAPEGDTTELEKLIARDPIISMRLLQTANSPAYHSGHGAVLTIPDAVRNLGRREICKIASTVGIFDSMPEIQLDGFDPIHSWQHSLAVATLCEQLVGKHPTIDGGMAYLVGLCHDLGDILLHTHFGKELREVQAFHDRTGQPIPTIERVMLGVTRSQLIQIILDRLGLPSAIRAAIMTFHDTPTLDAVKSKNPLTRLLILADGLADGAMLGTTARAPVMPFTKQECAVATGHDDPTVPDLATTRSEILAMTVRLSGLSPAEQNEQLKPPYTQSDVKVWIARDPLLSSLDPVSIALQSMAQVQISDRLPTVEELMGIKGVVFLTAALNSPGFTAAEIEKTIRDFAAAENVMLPALWLTRAHPEACIAKGLVKPTPSPIGLNDLDKFVQTCSAIVLEAPPQ